MTRRTLLTSGAAAPLASAAAAQPPNFVFLNSDDYSHGDLGCYRNPVVRTPNLDRLAAEGMRFENCFVSAAHHGHVAPELCAMPGWEPTIVDLLKQRGCHCGAFRKVHQGADFDQRWDFYGDVQTPFTRFFDSLPAGKPFCLHVGFLDPHRPYKKGT